MVIFPTSSRFFFRWIFHQRIEKSALGDAPSKENRVGHQSAIVLRFKADRLMVVGCSFAVHCICTRNASLLFGFSSATNMCVVMTSSLVKIFDHDLFGWQLNYLRVVALSTKVLFRTMRKPQRHGYLVPAICRTRYSSPSHTIKEIKTKNIRSILCATFKNTVPYLCKTKKNITTNARPGGRTRHSLRSKDKEIYHPT